MSARLEISRDMMLDIARARNNRETWATIGHQFGVSARTIKAAYLRKSREIYGDPRCGQSVDA